MLAPAPKTIDGITEELEAPAKGVLIPGKPDLFIPEETLRAMDKIGDDMRAEEAAARAAGKVECVECANQDCTEWFMPRKGTGGKPQKYCSATCKANDHVHGSDSKDVPNVASKSPTLAAAGPNVGKSPADEFDWGDDPSVVFREQPETAIYFNRYNALVIRQNEGWPYENGDPIIIVAEHNIAEFLDKLTRICGVPSVGR